MRLMNYNVIEELSVEELIKAGKQGDSEALFCVFLGADSLLSLTPEDKAFYSMLFNGESDQKAIAEKLGISYNSVRVKRSKLYEEYIRSKLNYVLLNMIFSKQPKRIYNKRPVAKQSHLTQIPYFISPDSEIAGFVTNKDELHTNPALSEYIHATTIVLMAKRLPDGELFFLTCDKKAYNMDNLTGEAPVRNRYDSPAGGHLELQDIPEGENRLSDKAFANCAVRELNEEIYLRRAVLQPEKARYLFQLSYKSANSGSGRHNNEFSYVYLYLLEKQTDVRVRERYTDTIGKTVNHELRIRYFTYKDLLDEFKSPENFSDGLGRVVSHLIERPEAYEELKKISVLMETGQKQ